jgi:hypothetical protein
MSNQAQGCQLTVNWNVYPGLPSMNRGDSICVLNGFSTHKAHDPPVTDIHQQI